MKRAKGKTRKPLELVLDQGIYAHINRNSEIAWLGVLAGPHIHNQAIGAKEARRLADWLLRFADWSEARKK